MTAVPSTADIGYLQSGGAARLTASAAPGLKVPTLSSPRCPGHQQSQCSDVVGHGDTAERLLPVTRVLALAFLKGSRLVRIATSAST